ncbi:MAG: hypothetical protein IPI39_19155 [Candidatus Obscuribacter sp.]|nr:hypothetical protein [Candidatus Obscuribacter sp.]
MALLRQRRYQVHQQVFFDTSQKSHTNTSASTLTAMIIATLESWDFANCASLGKVHPMYAMAAICEMTDREALALALAQHQHRLVQQSNAASGSCAVLQRGLQQGQQGWQQGL